MNKIVIIAYLKFIIDHLNSHYWTDYWIYNLTVDIELQKTDLHVPSCLKTLLNEF